MGEREKLQCWVALPSAAGGLNLVSATALTLTFALRIVAVAVAKGSGVRERAFHVLSHYEMCAFAGWSSGRSANDCKRFMRYGNGT